MDKIKCDRCGELISDSYSYCVIGVFLSGSSKSYRFCDKCYKDIAKVMESKDEVPFNIIEMRERLTKTVQDLPYPARTYPVKFINNDRWYYWPAKYPQIDFINDHGARKARRAITNVTA